MTTTGAILSRVMLIHIDLKFNSILLEQLICVELEYAIVVPNSLVDHLFIVKVKVMSADTNR